MTLSPRLTRDPMLLSRLRTLARTLLEAPVDSRPEDLVFAEIVKLAPALLPHLGAQEAPRPMTDTLRALQEALQRYDTMPDADDPWVAAARGQEVADAVRDYLRAPPRFDTTCSMVTGIPDPPLPSSAGSSAVPAPDARVYPCADCGIMRSQDEGGTTFTVCESCWDKHWGKERASPPAVSGPWRAEEVIGSLVPGRKMGWVVVRGKPGDKDYFATITSGEAEAIAIRDALNRVAAQRPQEESR